MLKVRICKVGITIIHSNEDAKSLKVEKYTWKKSSKLKIIISVISAYWWANECRTNRKKLKFIYHMHIIMLQNKTQNISIVKLRPVDHFAQRLHYSIFNLSIPGSIIFNLIISYNNLIVYRDNCFYHRPSDTWFIISIHNFVDAILSHQLEHFL